MKYTILLASALFLLVTGCKKKGCTDELASNYNQESKKDDGSCVYTPELILKVKMDSTQVRLDNFGNPSSIPAENATQSPIFHGISAHFVELSVNENVPPGSGVQLIKGAETIVGGDNAVDFSKAIIKNSGEVFYKIPLSEVPVGTYDYIRASITYQEYDIQYYIGANAYSGRLASFVGWNTYITNYKLDNDIVSVNANKLQGYFGFKSIGGIIEGQTPVGATTVPNPIASTSPIPEGSCLVTGQFSSPLVINGNEKSDIVITLSLSTNNSFEWKDDNSNGLFEPLAGDTVVNMGLRGLIPLVE